MSAASRITDEQLENLIVRFAVIETLTLHLAAYLADGAGKPREAALAILSDIRGSFDTGGAPAVVAFEGMARDYIDRLEPRLLRLVQHDRDANH